MYDALVALFGVRTLRSATMEPEDPETGGTLSIGSDDDGSNEGNSDSGSSDDD
jgi:hypothetical protein